MDPVSIGVATAPLVIQLLKSIFGGKAEKEMASQLSQGQAEAMKVMRGAADTAIGSQQPILQGGTADFQNLRAGMGAGLFDTPVPEFNYDDWAVTPKRFEYDDWSTDKLADDPGYQFRLGQGMEAIKGSAAARGNRLGGGTLKALMEFGQGLASQEADKAYNRFGTERAFDYNTGRSYLTDVLNERNFAKTGQQDYFKNLQNELGTRYSNLKGTADMGQSAASNVASTATGLATGMADIAGNQGAGAALRTGAGTQPWMDFLDVLGESLPLFLGNNANLKGGTATPPEITLDPYKKGY